MSVKKRFMEHLEAKGHIPKGYSKVGPVKKYAHGGMVDEEEGEEMSPEWEDDHWNQHEDTSGEPILMGEGNYMHEYAFGGKVKADEHEEPMEPMHGRDYAKPNYAGPEEHEEPKELSPEMIKRHMARALLARKHR
jgi:hypothetical protein